MSESRDVAIASRVLNHVAAYQFMGFRQVELRLKFYWVVGGELRSYLPSLGFY